MRRLHLNSGLRAVTEITSGPGGVQVPIRTVLLHFETASGTTTSSVGAGNAPNQFSVSRLAFPGNDGNVGRITFLLSNGGNAAICHELLVRFPDLSENKKVVSGNPRRACGVYGV